MWIAATEITFLVKVRWRKASGEAIEDGKGALLGRPILDLRRPIRELEFERASHVDFTKLDKRHLLATPAELHTFESSAVSERPGKLEHGTKTSAEMQDPNPDVGSPCQGLSG